MAADNTASCCLLAHHDACDDDANNANKKKETSSSYNEASKQKESDYIQKGGKLLHMLIAGMEKTTLEANKRGKNNCICPLSMLAKYYVPHLMWYNICSQKL